MILTGTKSNILLDLSEQTHTLLMIRFRKMFAAWFALASICLRNTACRKYLCVDLCVELRDDRVYSNIIVATWCSIVKC